jgi:hypothetical protein
VELDAVLILVVARIGTCSPATIAFSFMLDSVAIEYFATVNLTGQDPLCRSGVERPIAIVCNICRSRELQFLCSVLGVQRGEMKKYRSSFINIHDESLGWTQR